MINIEIKSQETRTKSGVSKKGKPYSITEQFGWVTLANGETRRVVIALEDGALPYASGRYELHRDSLYVDGFGQLALGRLKLVPVSAASVQPKAA